MKYGTAKIYCRKSKRDNMDFYLTNSSDEEDIYLFSTNYFTDMIYGEYCNGKSIEHVFKNTCNVRQQNIRARIIRMIKYVEKEYDIQLLAKTIAKTQNRQYNHRCLSTA